MKICAITMVYRDYWALSQWYAHYGRHLGEDNLFIVAHGSDPMVQALCPKASVMTVPRDTLAGFDRVRNSLLNSLQNALGHVYDWVLRTDTDELVCVDPALYGSFQDLLSSQNAPALFALGFNLVEMDDDDLLGEDELALSKRSTAVFSGHYSKAWAVGETLSLDRHGIRIRSGRVEGFEYALPRGVYLAHLKFANRAATATANVERMNAAQGDGRGLPGKSWKFADKRADRFFDEVKDMPTVDWEIAESDAYDKLATPVRNVKDGLIRAQSLRFKTKTILPDWFRKS